MNSVAQISFDVIQRFNPTQEDVKEIIKMLSATIVKKKRPKEMTSEEKFAQEFEEWMKAKLYAPKKK